MKSTGVNAGNVNLKGRKSKLLGCGCCVAQDFREREACRAADKEIADIYINADTGE